MGERIIIQLQHANSAVVLTTIKALLYLMNYMEKRQLMDHICKKMGPPLGEENTPTTFIMEHSNNDFDSDPPLIWA